MNFKLINKNSIGVIILLLLTVILSQSRFLNFMINTVLGRSLLIIILLFVSSIHKILGIVCVLLIIIVFNNSDFSYFEGMTTATTQATPGTKTTPSVTSTVPTVPAIPATPVVTPPPTVQSPAVSTPAVVTPSVNSQPTIPQPTSQAQEGFDIIGKERTIQKGRNSNSIPVNNYMKKPINDDVAPYEWSAFSGNFTEF